MCHFAYGGMDYAEAERSLRLFVHDVLPELQRLGERNERIGAAT
jgi:hypothetical protein